MSDQLEFRKDPADRRYVGWAVGIILVAIILRVCNLILSRGDPYFWTSFGDEEYYHAWGLKIAAGEIVGHSAFFTSPLYAYFLGIVYALAGPHLLGIKIIHLLMGTGSAVMILLSARRLFSGAWSLVPPFLSSICVAPIFYESFAEKTALVYFLASVCLYGALCVDRNRKGLTWIALGFIGGVAVLAHFVLAAMVAAVVARIVLTFWHEKKGLAKALGFFVLSFSFPVGLSIAHNLLAEGDLVVLSANGGHNFYIGNSADNPLGTYKAPAFLRETNLEHEKKDFHLEAERRLGKRLKSSDVSSYWFRQGFVAIWNHPGISLVRFGRKIRSVFHSDELTDTRSLPFYIQRSRFFRWPLPSFGLISVIGIIGIVASVKEKKFIALHLVAVVFAVLLGLFFVYGRYRLPLMTVLSLYSVPGIAWLFSALRTRRFLSAAACLVVGGFAYYFVFGKQSVQPVDFAVDHYNMAVMLERRGNTESALKEYTEALGANPRHVASMSNAGVLLIKTGRLHEAVALLKTAVELRPGAATNWNSLGVGLFRLGLREEAIDAYERAIALRPDYSTPYDSLGNVFLAQGKTGKAEQSYLQALRLEPSSWRTRYNLSVLYERVGKRQQAIEQLIEAKKVQPTNPIIAQRLEVLNARRR